MSSEHNDPLANMIFSSISAFLARSVTHPIDTLKTRLQYSQIPTRVDRAFINIVKKESFLSLYKGLSVSLLFSVPALTCYLSTYDYLKVVLSNGKPQSEQSLLVHATAATTAECLSGFIWTPMELLKNKLQVGSPDAKNGTLSLVKQIYKTEGLRGFFKGYWLGLGVFLPYTISYFVTYEQFKLLTLNSKKTEYLTFPQYIMCSAMSGTVAGSISNVMDVVKTKVQIDGKSPLNIMKEFWSEGGLRPFTRGMMARVLFVIPSITLSIATYDTLKDWRKQGYI